MELDSALAGSALRDFTATTNWRETTNYAAAIDDYNDLYFDDTRDEGIIAHPMYTVALTWKLIGNLGHYVQDDALPLDVLRTQVHYTEYIEFHRPLLPGEEITIKSSLAAVLPHRSGTHAVMRMDAFDAQGQPVFTEMMGGLMRGVTCKGEGAGEDLLPQIPELDSDEGLWESKVYIDKTRPYVYDGCSNIFFPIHTSPDFAAKVGLPGILLQGTATLAYAVREIINRDAGGDPRRLKRLYCRFTGMVQPDSDIRIVRKKNPDDNEKEIFFDVLNAQGKKALSKGYIELKEGEA